MNSNIYYVYAHVRPDTNNVFYVGKGHGKRAWQYGRNEHWERTVKKAGSYHVEIVASGLDEQTSFILEEKLIAWYGRENLTYMTDGGAGGDTWTGRKHSPESIEKMCQAQKGKKKSTEHREKLRQANLGKKLSPEAIEKMRRALKGKPGPNKGKKASPETREKMRQAHLGKKQSSQTIEKRKQTKLGKKLSDEAREKLRQAHLGKKRSPEVREKMRLAWIKRRKNKC